MNRDNILRRISQKRFLGLLSFLSISLFILAGITVISETVALAMLAFCGFIDFFVRKWYPHFLKDLPGWWADLIPSPAVHIGIILSVAAILLGLFWVLIRGYSVEIKVVKERI